MDSSDDSSEEPELQEVCLYTLKMVIRNKFEGPLFKYLSSNGFSYNYYVERTTKKMIKIRCHFSNCPAKMHIKCHNKEVFSVQDGRRGVIVLDANNDELFDIRNFGIISTIGEHTCNVTTSECEKTELLEFLQEFISSQSDLPMISQHYLHYARNLHYSKKNDFFASEHYIKPQRTTQI